MFSGVATLRKAIARQLAEITNPGTATGMVSGI